MMNKQKGNLIAIAVIIIVAVSAFAVVVVKLIASESQSHNRFLKSHQSAYLAESGMEYAMLQIKDNIDLTSLATYCDGSYKSTQSFGEGEFRFKCDVYTPSGVTTVGATSAGADIVDVSSLTGVAPIGRVFIEGEFIDYSDTSTDSTVCGTQPCLVVKTRGANTSTAASHSAGTAVEQTQIVVTADGAVPTIASPTTENTIQSALAAPNMTWAIGKDGLIFNRQLDGEWINVVPSPSTSKEFYDVACLNSFDCWMVGESGEVYRWDGSDWNSQTSTYSSAFDGNTLTDIACPSTTVCFVLDDQGYIYRWDGSTWTQSSNKVPDVQNDVACASTTLCFTVGKSGTIRKWTGSSSSDITVAWPADTSPTGNELNAVSCPTSTLCFAGGGSGDIIEFNGTSWSGPVNPVGDSIVSLSCPNSVTDFCYATSENHDKAATYNGTSWSSSTTTTSGTSGKKRRAIYCPSSTQCFATGEKLSGNVMLISWNGSSWTNDTVDLGSASEEDLDAINSDILPGADPLGIKEIVWKEVYN